VWDWLQVRLLLIERMEVGIVKEMKMIGTQCLKMESALYCAEKVESWMVWVTY
jgi:hypothetical protein